MNAYIRGSRLLSAFALSFLAVLVVSAPSKTEAQLASADFGVINATTDADRVNNIWTVNVYVAYNVGSVTAQNVVMTYHMGMAAPFVPRAGSPCAVDSSNATLVRCALGVMQPGESRTVHVDFRVTEAMFQCPFSVNITGYATVQSELFDPNGANNAGKFLSTTITCPQTGEGGNLHLIKQGSAAAKQALYPDPKDPSKNIVAAKVIYNLMVGNQNATNQVQNVTVIDTPFGMSEHDWDVVALPQQGSCFKEGNTVKCNVGTLPTVTQVPINLHFYVKKCGFTLRNDAAVTSTNMPTTNQNDASQRTVDTFIACAPVASSSSSSSAMSSSSSSSVVSSSSSSISSFISIIPSDEPVQQNQGMTWDWAWLWPW